GCLFGVGGNVHPRLGHHYDRARIDTVLHDASRIRLDRITVKLPRPALCLPAAAGAAVTNEPYRYFQLDSAFSSRRSFSRTQHSVLASLTITFSFSRAFSVQAMASRTTAGASGPARR